MPYIGTMIKFKMLSSIDKSISKLSHNNEDVEIMNITRMAKETST